MSEAVEFLHAAEDDEEEDTYEENDDYDYDEFEIDEDECGPVVTAAFYDDLNELRSLLKHGADKDETLDGCTAMWYAASNGHLEIMRLLVRKPTNKE